MVQVVAAGAIFEVFGEIGAISPFDTPRVMRRTLGDVVDTTLAPSHNREMIAIIDNYDSFTYNLVQRLGEIDASVDVRVFRNDQITVPELADLKPSHLILSPGPCTPNEAGISVTAADYFGGKIPLLGVCLGHQSIGQSKGSAIVRAKHLMHGKADEIHHDDKGIFAGLPNPFIATRYHSLVIRPDTVSDEFDIAAWSIEPDGSREVMGIRHKKHAIVGWQFHPESFLTTVGPQLLQRFMAMV